MRDWNNIRGKIESSNPTHTFKTHFFSFPSSLSRHPHTLTLKAFLFKTHTHQHTHLITLEEKKRREKREVRERTEWEEKGRREEERGGEEEVSEHCWSEFYFFLLLKGFDHSVCKSMIIDSKLLTLPSFCLDWSACECFSVSICDNNVLMLCGKDACTRERVFVLLCISGCMLRLSSNTCDDVCLLANSSWFWVELGVGSDLNEFYPMPCLKIAFLGSSRIFSGWKYHIAGRNYQHLGTESADLE